MKVEKLLKKGEKQIEKKLAILFVYIIIKNIGIYFQKYQKDHLIHYILKGEN